jgi:hypothetical protein
VTGAAVPVLGAVVDGVAPAATGAVADGDGVEPLAVAGDVVDVDAPEELADVPWWPGSARPR